MLSKPKLGQIVYYCITDKFIVTAKIVEIVKYWDIRSLELEGIESTQSFEFTNEKGESLIKVGYYDWKTQSMVDLSDRYEEIKQKCSEGETSYWIDEPVGYGLSFDDDHIYLTLHEALRDISTVDRRRSKRRIKNVQFERLRKIEFINSTRKNDPVDFKLNSESKKYKKIYCKIGRKTK